MYRCGMLRSITVVTLCCELRVEPLAVLRAVALGSRSEQGASIAGPGDGSGAWAGICSMLPFVKPGEFPQNISLSALHALPPGGGEIGEMVSMVMSLGAMYAALAIAAGKSGTAGPVASALEGAKANSAS